MFMVSLARNVRQQNSYIPACAYTAVSVRGSAVARKPRCSVFSDLQCTMNASWSPPTPIQSILRGCDLFPSLCSFLVVRLASRKDGQAARAMQPNSMQTLGEGEYTIPTGIISEDTSGEGKWYVSIDLFLFMVLPRW